MWTTYYQLSRRGTIHKIHGSVNFMVLGSRVTVRYIFGKAKSIKLRVKDTIIVIQLIVQPYILWLSRVYFPVNKQVIVPLTVSPVCYKCHSVLLFSTYLFRSRPAQTTYQLDWATYNRTEREMCHTCMAGYSICTLHLMQCLTYRSSVNIG